MTPPLLSSFSPSVNYLRLIYLLSLFQGSQALSGRNELLIDLFDGNRHSPIYAIYNLPPLCQVPTKRGYNLQLTPMAFWAANPALKLESNQYARGLSGTLPLSYSRLSRRDEFDLPGIFYCSVCLFPSFNLQLDYTI